MDLSAIVAELKQSTDTFGPFIRSQAAAIPDRVALKFETETVTYGAYDALVEGRDLRARLQTGTEGQGHPHQPDRHRLVTRLAAVVTGE